MQLVSPNNNILLSSLANRSAVEKVSTTLAIGFNARAAARQKLKERWQEQYTGKVTP